MKLIIYILAISFIFVNILGITKYFSTNKNYYIDYSSGINSSEKLLADNFYDFLQGKSDLDNQFTPSEISHMNDVKNLFKIFNIILFVFSFVFILSLAYMLIKAKYEQMIRGLIIGSSINIFLLIILALLINTNFRHYFDIFHYLLFPQGNRIFPENSLLISLFPENFFMSISKKIFSNIIGISSIVLGFCIITKKLLKTKN